MLMFKKKRIVGNFTTNQLWLWIGVYLLMSLVQIGLPEKFENTREVLTYIQLGMWIVLSLLVVINLIKNWE